MKIAIVNQKGGVGKTTTSVNLAACLAERGKRTLLIDMDPQGNATSGAGIGHDDIGQTAYEVLTRNVPLEEALLPTAVKKLSVVPADIQLAGAEIELSTAMAREAKMKKALERIEHRFDFILMDCPPSLGLLTVNAMTAADTVIVPMQSEYFAMEGLAQLLQSFELVKQYLNEDIELLGIVMTMVSRTKLSKEVVAEVRRYFQDKTFATEIPRNIRLTEAPGYGEPIILYDKRSSGAENYRKLAAEVIKRCRT